MKTRNMITQFLYIKVNIIKDFKNRLFSTLFVFLPCFAFSQSDAALQRVKNIFNGSQISTTVKEEYTTVWTTYYFDMHFCTSGQIVLYGLKETTTYYTDMSRERDTSYGTWKVMKMQGEVIVQVTWSNGNYENWVIQLFPNGNFWIKGANTVRHNGRAQCY